jgi:hypothetical protein
MTDADIVSESDVVAALGDLCRQISSLGAEVARLESSRVALARANERALALAALFGWADAAALRVAYDTNERGLRDAADVPQEVSE